MHRGRNRRREQGVLRAARWSHPTGPLYPGVKYFWYPGLCRFRAACAACACLSVPVRAGPCFRVPSA
eukprot:5385427-Prymnesium_polylepis.1